MSNREESAMYDLGRQAREHDFQTVSCNVRDRVKRSWWLAGWHDLDIEKGVNKFFDDVNRPAIEDKLNVEPYNTRL